MILRRVCGAQIQDMIFPTLAPPVVLFLDQFVFYSNKTIKKGCATVT